MSDSVGPHRGQLTRLPHSWISPGKNTGVGCHFLLQCVKVMLLSHVRSSATPWTAAFQAPPSMGFSRQEYWSGVPLPVLPRILLLSLVFQYFVSQFLKKHRVCMIHLEEKERLRLFRNPKERLLDFHFDFSVLNGQTQLRGGMNNSQLLID